MVSPCLKNLFFVAFILILNASLAQASQPFQNPEDRPHVQFRRVVSVIDGDTIIIEGGKKVRYLGIDTPEIGQPFYEEAKNKNKELVMGKTVRLEVCKAEPRDKYGRFLAYVYIDKTMANVELLKNGYARILTIPPCGIEKAEEFRQYQKEAMKKRAGLWGARERIITKDFIPASDAGRFIDERKAVYGKAFNIYEGRKAIFLEVGNAGKTTLRVVIFKQDKKNFEDNGINPLTYYKGKDVVIYGKIKMYKGNPEIVIGGPSQIEVW